MNQLVVGDPSVVRDALRSRDRLSGRAWETCLDRSDRAGRDIPTLNRARTVEIETKGEVGAGCIRRPARQRDEGASGPDHAVQILIDEQGACAVVTDGANAVAVWKPDRGSVSPVDSPGA